jgi:hypothetical protein
MHVFEDTVIRVHVLRIESATSRGMLLPHDFAVLEIESVIRNATVGGVVEKTIVMV